MISLVFHIISCFSYGFSYGEHLRISIDLFFLFKMIVSFKCLYNDLIALVLLLSIFQALAFLRTSSFFGGLRFKPFKTSHPSLGIVDFRPSSGPHYSCKIGKTLNSTK